MPDYRPIPGQSDSGPSPGGPSDDVTSMAHDRMANLLMPYQDKYGAKPVAPPGGGGAPPGGAAPTSTEDKLYQAVHPDTFNRVLESIMSMVTGRAAPRQLGGGVGGGGGDYIVGEEGPERLQLAPGSAGYVTPNPATQMRGTPRVGGGPVNSFYNDFYAGRSNFGGGEEDDWTPSTPPPDPRSQIPPPTPGAQRRPAYGDMSTFGGAQRGPSGFADPSSGFRGSSAGFSAGANATYAKNLIGEPGGPLSAGATEQYKQMGMPLPMAEGGPVAAPMNNMGNFGPVDVSNLGTGGMTYQPEFRPAQRGQNVGGYPTPMGPMGGLRYASQAPRPFRPAVRGENVGGYPTPMGPMRGLTYRGMGQRPMPTPMAIGGGIGDLEGISPTADFGASPQSSISPEKTFSSMFRNSAFRNFPYGPGYKGEGEEAPINMQPDKTGTYRAAPRFPNEEYGLPSSAPSGAGPSSAGGEEGWKDYEEGTGIRYKRPDQITGPRTVAPYDYGMRPAMTPEQVELGERDKWATPGYADRMNAEASARSPLTFNPNTGRAEGAVGRVTPGYEKGYYDAHPEERMMDMMTATNKPQMDMLQKQLDQFTNIIQGYGTAGMGPKQAAAMRDEATRAIPMIQAEMGRLSGQGPEMMKAGMENAPGSPKNLELAARAKYYEGIGDVRRDVAAEQAESRKRPFFSPTGEGYLYDEHGKLQRIPGTKDDHKIISKLQEESTKYDEFGHKSGYDHKEFRRRLKDAADAGIISKEVMDAFPPPKPMDKTQWLTAAKNILKKSGRKVPDQWFEDQYKEYMEGLG